MRLKRYSNEGLQTLLALAKQRYTTSCPAVFSLFLLLLVSYKPLGGLQRGVQNDAIASQRSTEQTREGSDSNPVRSGIGPLILFEALGSHMGSL